MDSQASKEQKEYGLSEERVGGSLRQMASVLSVLSHSSKPSGFRERTRELQLGEVERLELLFLGNEVSDAR